MTTNIGISDNRVAQIEYVLRPTINDDDASRLIDQHEKAKEQDPNAPAPTYDVVGAAKTVRILDKEYAAHATTLSPSDSRAIAAAIDEIESTITTHSVYDWEF